MIEKRLRFIIPLVLGGVLLAGAAGTDAGGMRMGMLALWAQNPDGVDLGGRETNIRAWEETLRLPASSLLALDYYGNETWEEMISRQWVPGYWARRNPSRKLIWSIPLTMKGTPLGDVVKGLHDAEFRFGARAIAQSQPDAIIRIGWEMNGGWFAWAAAGHEADYIAAYRRVAAIFREASPKFSFDWCANWGLNAGPADLAYPGDDFVDTIGMDVYDVKTDKEPVARWRDEVLNTPYGLRWLEHFAAQHGKKMSVGEWGLGLKGAPDNPYFMDRMNEWLRVHADRIAFHVYFDVPPLSEGKFPKGRERFINFFSAPGR